MERLKGKVCIVTGGNKGIGKAIAELFLNEGAKMVYSCARSEATFEHPNYKHIKTDVTKGENVNAFVEQVKAESGRIDVLVNNAGVIKDAILGKMSEEDWDYVLNINLKGVFFMTKAVSPIMLEQGEGNIVNVSSLIGEYGNIGQTNYAATKAGLIGMTYTWAKEFTRKGANIRTNAVAPGYIETEMVLSVPEKILDTLRKKCPLGRLGKPEEVAKCVLFLASDDSSYVNGHVLSVAGGTRL